MRWIIKQTKKTPSPRTTSAVGFRVRRRAEALGRRECAGNNGARAVGMALLGLLLATTSVAATDDAASAAERFRSTLRDATTGVPGDVVRLDARSQRLGTVGALRSGAVQIEWQSEGLAFDSGREGNAADTLRLRRELTPPGLRRSLADLARSAGIAEESSVGLGLAEVALEAGGLWLELAAVRDELVVLEARAERLDAAVALHQKRLELGEVAGSEVTQLEVQRARDGVEMRRLGAHLRFLGDALRALAPGAQEPVAGDLAELLALSAPAATDEDRPAAGPWHAAATAQRDRATALAEVERRRAKGLPEGEIEVARIPSLAGVDSFGSLGFRVALPLAWGRAAAEKKAAAEAQAELARSRHELAQRRLRQRLDSARARRQAAEASLAALAPLLGDLSLREHALNEQFRLGAVTYLVYLDGLARLEQLLVDATRARLEAAGARFELATLISDPTIFPLATPVTTAGVEETSP